MPDPSRRSILAGFLASPVAVRFRAPVIKYVTPSGTSLWLPVVTRPDHLPGVPRLLVYRG